MSNFAFAPPARVVVPIVGSDVVFPVNRIFCVGRNYEDHAREMGFQPDREAPFYFTKSPASLVMSGGEIAYAPRTKDYHYEMEFVVAIGEKGSNIAIEDANSLIFGCGAGLDMTRRDLQITNREKGRPWCVGKDVDESAVMTPIVPIAEVTALNSGKITLTQNGAIKQESDLSTLIWSVPELIADLSTLYTLKPGDLIYTGTPAGVGPVARGDILTGMVENLIEFTVTIA